MSMFGRMMGSAHATHASPQNLNLRAIDGGPNFYGQFSHPLPDDPNYFPIGVWFATVSNQSDINLDKAAGLNLYVVLTNDSNLSLIQSNGMYAVLQSDDPAWTTNQTAINSPAVVGWLLSDEPDGLGTPAGYTDLDNAAARLPADGRFRFTNYAKAVGDGQGITDAQGAQYVNYQDVCSADIYWFTDPFSGGTTYPQNMLGYKYGGIIDRLRMLDAMNSSPRHPIWAFVEDGWPFDKTEADGTRQILPAEIKSAVWHSIIAGARGVLYFNHSFGGPELTFNVIRDPYYAAQTTAITDTNELINQLAPVLNSPFDDNFVTANAAIRVMAKLYNGVHYIFSGNTQNSSNTGTFTLTGVSTGTATVISESRTINISGGQFSDSFADKNAFHIYRID